MCLLALAWHAHPRFALVVAANRDEFHARPTQPLSRWDEPPGVLAGRDLRAGGTWLAARAVPRQASAPGESPISGVAFGAITNFREPAPVRADAPSRGALIPRFMASKLPPGEFLRSIEPDAARFAGLNLLLARGTELWYASNRTKVFARALEPGIYGLSNHTLDTPWPKLERIRADFEGFLEAHPDALDPEPLLDLLDQREPTPPGASLEDVLAAPFVVHPVFGTRSSTVVLVENGGGVTIVERRFSPEGTAVGSRTLTADTTSAGRA